MLNTAWPVDDRTQIPPYFFTVPGGHNAIERQRTLHQFHAQLLLDLTGLSNHGPLQATAGYPAGCKHRLAGF